MDVDTILLECEERMDKAVTHLSDELRGIRSGRATPALVEYVKVDYYGSMTDLRQLAAVTTPEPTQLLIKPFDAGAVQAISQAIQAAGLGLTPVVEAKQIRLSMPPLSQERRQQLANSVKQMGEQAKISIRNVRRKSNKAVDVLEKDKASEVTEDIAKSVKEEIQSLTKKSETTVDTNLKEKQEEILA